MHPVLFKIGPITIYSYGIFIASAVFLALAFSIKEAKRKGLDPKIASDLGFYSIIMGVIGSRLGYVLVNPSEFLKNPFLVFKLWEGGLVFISGFILGVLFLLFYLKKKKQPILDWLDTFAIGIPLGQFVGRIGCFMAGCCYGKVCRLPWAVEFHDPLSIAPQGVPLHPTQIYHSIAGLITFVVLFLVRKRVKTSGKLFFLLIVLYSFFRFIIEFFRGDPRPYLGPFSITQWLAIFMFFAGIFCVWKIKGQVHKLN